MKIVHVLVNSNYWTLDNYNEPIQLPVDRYPAHRCGPWLTLFAQRPCSFRTNYQRTLHSPGNHRVWWLSASWRGPRSCMLPRQPRQVAASVWYVTRWRRSSLHYARRAASRECSYQTRKVHRWPGVGCWTSVARSDYTAEKERGNQMSTQIKYRRRRILSVSYW